MMIFLFCTWLQMLIKHDFQQHFSLPYFFPGRRKKIVTKMLHFRRDFPIPVIAKSHL